MIKISKSFALYVSLLISGLVVAMFVCGLSEAGAAEIKMSGISEERVMVLEARIRALESAVERSGEMIEILKASFESDQITKIINDDVYWALHVELRRLAKHDFMLRQRLSVLR